MTQITVLIVSQVRLYREGLAKTLAQRPGIHRVHTAIDVPEALAQAAALCPAIVLLDPSAGFDCSVVGELRAASPGSRVVVLGVGAGEEEILACVEAGASGYLSLDRSLDDLVATIHNAAQDKMPCSEGDQVGLATGTVSALLHTTGPAPVDETRRSLLSAGVPRVPSPRTAPH